MSKKVITFAFMDPPYESARTSFFFRMLQEVILAGHHVYVFAYEGATSLSCAQQRPHANVIHGRDARDEDHPLPSQWVVRLRELAECKGSDFAWVNCGLCADERGVIDVVDGVKRGSPEDFYNMLAASDNALVIGTRS